MINMSKREVNYYICDNCRKESEDPLPFNDVVFDIPVYSLGEYDFCSFDCFKEFFNKTMKEYKVKVEIL